MDLCKENGMQIDTRHPTEWQISIKPAIYIDNETRHRKLERRLQDLLPTENNTGPHSAELEYMYRTFSNPSEQLIFVFYNSFVPFQSNSL